MKKLSLLFILTAASLLAFSSCLKNSGSKESPTKPGRAIFSLFMGQREIADDPALIALRLNILIETATLQGKLNSLDQVTAIINGREQNLKYYLFGNNTITPPSLAAPGIYKITFSLSNAGTYDNYRGGTVVIDTQGEILSNLPFGKHWKIYPEDDKYQFLASSGDIVEVRIPMEYWISPSSEENTLFFAASFMNFASAGSYDGDKLYPWTVTYRMTYTGENMAYETFRASKLSVTGESYGQVYGMDGLPMLTQTISLATPIEYNLSCSPILMTKGVEIITLNGISGQSDNFPKDDVRIKWTTGSSTCGNDIIISYNGYIEDYIGNKLDNF